MYFLVLNFKINNLIFFSPFVPIPWHKASVSSFDIYIFSFILSEIIDLNFLSVRKYSVQFGFGFCY